MRTCISVGFHPLTGSTSSGSAPWKTPWSERRCRVAARFCQFCSPVLHKMPLPRRGSAEGHQRRSTSRPTRRPGTATCRAARSPVWRPSTGRRSPPHWIEKRLHHRNEGMEPLLVDGAGAHKTKAKGVVVGGGPVIPPVGGAAVPGTEIPAPAA